MQNFGYRYRLHVPCHHFHRQTIIWNSFSAVLSAHVPASICLWSPPKIHPETLLPLLKFPCTGQLLSLPSCFLRKPSFPSVFLLTHNLWPSFSYGDPGCLQPFPDKPVLPLAVHGCSHCEMRISLQLCFHRLLVPHPVLHLYLVLTPHPVQILYYIWFFWNFAPDVLFPFFHWYAHAFSYWNPVHPFFHYGKPLYPYPVQWSFFLLYSEGSLL